VTRLPVDYAGLAGDLGTPLAPADVGRVLLGGAADRYERLCADCSLIQFMQSGATYLFDFASAVGAKQEDRTLAAWIVTPVSKRDVSYQRSFSLAADPADAPGADPAIQGLSKTGRAAPDAGGIRPGAGPSRTAGAALDSPDQWSRPL
jgi:hypothetical protein